MQDALGLSSGSRGIENEQRVLGVETLGYVLLVYGAKLFFPPKIAPLHPVHLGVGAVYHQHLLDGWALVVRQGFIDGRL